MIKVDGDTKPLEKSLGKIGSVAQKGLGVTVKGIAAISTGFAAATGAALKFRGELEQNLGGSKAVFKEFADDIQENAERAFSKAGLSASNYLATANKMGALFQGAGFTIKESADLTTQAMQRAADVASIMGIETSWAMESIAGAAKGNFTMMDNLGVAMNETTLNAYALEKGIGKTTSQMTNQEKIGLAMELFLERTAYAAGNYAKENETLAGSLGTAKASLENFMAGAGNVDDVVDSILNAGKVIAKNIKELLPELGQGLSEGLRQILAEVPGFIDDNAEEFAQGAADLVVVLVNAIIDGAPEMAEAASKLLVVFADELGEAVPILKPVTEVISFLGENLETTAKVAIATGVAFETYTITAGAAKAATVAYATAKQTLATHEAAHRLTLLASNGALTAQELLVGVLTGKIPLLIAAKGLATKAQIALNAAWTANPVGIVVAVVAALAVGLGVLYAATRKQTEAEQEQAARLKEVTEKTKELTEASKEQEAAYLSSIDSINKSTSAELAELSCVESLADELFTLADESGRVDEANRARASFILGELNEAMGTEYTLTGNQISKYGELKTSIYDTIDAMQAKIVLAAYEDMLTEAIKRQAEAQKNATGAYTALTEAEQSQDAAISAFISKYEQLHGVTLDAVAAEEQLKKGKAQNGALLWGIIDDYNEASAAIASNTALIEESGQASQEVAELRAAVSSATTAIELGNFEEVVNGYQMSEDAKKAIASGSEAEILATIVKKNAEIEDLEARKNAATTEEEKKGWQALIDAAAKDGANLVAEYEKTGKNATEGLAQHFRDGGTAIEAAKTLAQNIINKIKGVFDEHSPSRVMRYDVAGNATKGIVLGFKDGEKEVYAAAEKLAEKGIDGYNAGQEANSPAKEYIKASKNSIDGLIKGIDDNADRLMDRMEELSDEALTAEITGNDALLDAERKYLSESRRMEREKEEKEYKEKLAAAKTAEAAQKIKNERLQKLQEEADERYLDQLRETAEAERESVEERKNKIIDTFQDAADAAMDAVEDLADRQESFREKLLGDVKLFKKVTFKGAGEDGTDLQFTDLADLDKQSRALEEYADLLLKVRDREELPNGFFDELREMSIEEGTAFAKTLLDADDDTFARYIQSWNDIQNTGDRLAKEVFGEDTEELKGKFEEELKRKFEEEFGQLPEDFFKLGEDSIQQFGSGFMSKLQELMRNVKQEIERSLSYLSPVPIAGAVAGSAGTGNTSFHTVYNFSSSGETVHQQLQTARDADTVKQLRG